VPRYVAFLRGINVGGHNVKMEHLRRLFEAEGFSGVETFIASGNVVFETRSRKAATLEERIAVMLQEALGYEVAAFVRTDGELAEMASYKPFRQAELDAALALNVALMGEGLDGDGLRTLASFETDFDKFHAHGREVYWLCYKKQSESEFFKAPFERSVRRRVTWRTVNTVKRLSAKLSTPKP
jgi:uncharacterized protein (DUF1697 family)